MEAHRGSSMDSLKVWFLFILERHLCCSNLRNFFFVVILMDLVSQILLWTFFFHH
jgi:hypothetical protein